MQLRRFVPVMFLLVASLLAGCGPKTLPQKTTYPVHGAIRLNGEPAKFVMVTFTPVEPGKGMEAVGRTDEEGKFELRSYSNAENDGAAAGEYNVTIERVDPVKGGGLPAGKTATAVPRGGLTAKEPVTISEDETEPVIDFQSP
jgi:hypothetical protein